MPAITLQGLFWTLDPRIVSTRVTFRAAVLAVIWCIRVDRCIRWRYSWRNWIDYIHVTLRGQPTYEGEYQQREVPPAEATRLIASHLALIRARPGGLPAIGYTDSDDEIF